MQEIKIISIVSGKGGVGKTTLAVSMAKESAISGHPVLIIDLDMFNRGFSELVKGRGCKVFDISSDNLVCSPGEGHDSHWEVYKFAHNIFGISIPEDDKKLLDELETIDQAILATSLRNFILAAAHQVGARVVFLDCHGSRDKLSFAAVNISDDCLVVSAAEIITFFGTVNFIKSYFQSFDPQRKPANNFHLIFNSIKEGFSETLLTHWYKFYLKDYFIDERPYAIIPYDPQASFSVSENLFPTEVFYYSIFAEKIRILIYDLFKHNTPELVSKEAEAVALYSRYFYTGTTIPFSGILGTKPLILFLFYLFTGIAAIILFFSVYLTEAEVKVLAEEVVKEYELTTYLGVLFLISLLSFWWIIITSITKLTISFDGLIPQHFSYISENIKKFAIAISRWVCMVVSALLLIGLAMSYDPNSSKLIATSLVLGLALVGQEGNEQLMHNFLHTADVAIACYGIVCSAILAVVFSWRTYRAFAYRIHSTEFFYRATIAATVSILFLL